MRDTLRDAEVQASPVRARHMKPMPGDCITVEISEQAFEEVIETSLFRGSPDSTLYDDNVVAEVQHEGDILLDKIEKEQEPLLSTLTTHQDTTSETEFEKEK